MAPIIRRREVVEDDFAHVADDVEPAPGGPAPIVSLARFAAAPDALLARFPRLGVRVPCDRLPADLPAIDRLALICVELPAFTDGRAYTLARMLRDRHGFRGELRAIGQVLRDQLRYLERCGFDAFELAPGRSLASAVEAFGELGRTYQAAADERRPIYRRSRG